MTWRPKAARTLRLSFPDVDVLRSGDGPRRERGADPALVLLRQLPPASPPHHHVAAVLERGANGGLAGRVLKGAVDIGGGVGRRVPEHLRVRVDDEPRPRGRAGKAPSEHAPRRLER